MKFLNYTLLMLFSLALISKEQFKKDKLMRMDTFLSQTMQIGSNVHIYGGNGVILTSKDSCKTWTQKSLHDTLQIYKIEPLNNYFIGLGTKNLILYLDSNLNLIKANQLDTKIRSMSNFIVKDNYIYLQNDSAIYKFDLIKNKLDTSFNAKFKYRINNICIADNSIFLRATSTLLIRFNLLNNSFDTINVSQKTVIKNSINNLQSFNNTIYFTNNTDVFSSTDLGETWETKKGIQHNKLYINYKGLHLYSISKDGINNGFVRYAKAEFNQIKFDTISNIKLDKVFNNLQVIGINHIFDKSQILVGDEKLIIYSQDNGNSFDVKSYLGNNISNFDGMRFHFVNKNLGYVFLDKRPLYVTIDGGVTWQQKSLNDTIRLNFRAYGIYAFNEKGDGFHLDSQKDFGDYKELPNARLFNDTLNKISFYDQGVVKGLSWVKSNVIQEKDYVMFSSSTQANGTSSSSLYYSYFVKTNYKYENPEVNRLDSFAIQTIGFFDESKTKLFAFGREFKMPVRDSISYWKFLKNDYLILESTDQGKSWNEIYRLKQQMINSGIAFYKNNFYTTFYNERNIMGILTISNGVESYSYLDSSFIANSPSGAKQLIEFVVFDSTLYNFAYKSILKLNENNSWDVMDSTTKYFFTDPIVLGKTVFFREKSNTSGSFFVPHIFKYFAEDDSVKTNIEESVEEVKEFMLFPPYPNPSIGKINLNIIANNKLVVNPSKVKIVDIMGLEQNIQDKVSIVKLDEFNYNLKLDCENLGTGIYFIVVKINNASEYMPFVISR